MVEKLDRANELGILKDGWAFLDYCQDAAPTQKWICSILWGEKGSLKSNELLQDGYSVFHGFDRFIELENGLKKGIIDNWQDMEAWEKVKQFFVVRPIDFVKILREALKGRYRLGWVGWDDINIHLPRSMYSTNRAIWEEFAKNWEGFRANLSIFECTAPRKDKVVSFILADMNWEKLISGRHIAEVRRWFWDSDYYEPERVNKFRLDIETHQVVQDHVPSEVWSWYWERKMKLNDESTENFAVRLTEIDKPPEIKKKEGPTLAPCSKCGKPMTEWNLSVHEPKCNGIEVAEKIRRARSHVA